jgi:hypothetical protein
MEVKVGFIRERQKQKLYFIHYRQIGLQLRILEVPGSKIWPVILMVSVDFLRVSGENFDVTLNQTTATTFQRHYK